MLRIAHISDPHFAEITYSLKQFLSKRWLGNCNLILFRQKTLQQLQLLSLPKFLKDLNVKFACITGDLSTTSLPEEFKKASQFIDCLKEENIKPFLLPGNHDFYTVESEKTKRFYTFFPSQSKDYSLKEDRLECHLLEKGWWLISLDNALATSVIFSNGKFFKEIEPKLIKSLSEIPKEDKVIIINHFPLFKKGSPRHFLWRAEKLQEILRAFPNVKLYLHGHDHTPYQIDRQREGFPLVFNAGSCSHLPKGLFNTYDLTDSECIFCQYAWNGKTFEKIKSTTFPFFR